MDGLRNAFASTIFWGDGAACADDDDLVNEFDAHKSVEGCSSSSSSSISGNDKDDNLCSNSISLLPPSAFSNDAVGA